jgi:hypothetical protein
MLVWETDPTLRDSELGAAFADVWCAIPKVVFSRTLDNVQGNARLAEASVAEEAAAALAATDKDVSIGGAGLAAAAVELGLVDELRMLRYPVVIGGGTPFLPPVPEDVRSSIEEVTVSHPDANGANHGDSIPSMCDHRRLSAPRRRRRSVGRRTRRRPLDPGPS